MDSASYFMTMSSKQVGALGILCLHASEAMLNDRIDREIGGRAGTGERPPMTEGELRHGWIRTADGEEVDEVMLARPGAGMRVLMTHGGAAVAGAVKNWLNRRGFPETAPEQLNAYTDHVYDPLLSLCVTEGQVAAVLEERQRVREEGGAFALRPEVMRAHRVALAGAPNAGKSSLLNALSGYRRAFVHEEAGATRDVVDELVDVGGYAVVLGDMPGFSRERTGLAEEAWRRALPRLRTAEQVWFVVDGSGRWEGEAEAAAAEVAKEIGPEAASRVLVVLNKSDLPRNIPDAPWLRHFPAARSVRVSSLPDGNAGEILGAAFIRGLGN